MRAKIFGDGHHLGTVSYRPGVGVSWDDAADRLVGSVACTDGNGNPVEPEDGKEYLYALQRALDRSTYTHVEIVE